jgi:hypothetical protein
MLRSTFLLGKINRGIVNVTSFFTLPSIGALYRDVGDTERVGFSRFLYAAFDFLKLGFPVYTDHFEEIVANNIGEQVLVAGVENSNSGGFGANDAGILHKVADNIVPEPRKWSMHGYLGYSSNNIFANVTRMIPVNIGSFIDKFGRETLLSAIKEYVRFLANARKPFKFTTPEGESVPALIKDCKFSNKAENKNFIEVDLEIQEFRYLGVVKDEGQYVGGNYNYGINKTANVLGRSVAKALFL